MKTIIAGKEIELSDEQLTILNDTRSFVVDGCVGSGKTILCILKAQKLVNEGNSCIVIVYTKALKAYIEQVLFKLSELEGIVYTLYESRNLDLEWIDYIIVDEVQDVTMKDVNRFESLATKGIFLFGDDDQKLYDKNTEGEITTSVSEIIQNKKLKSYNLEINYRNCKEIGLLLNAAFKKSTNLAVEDEGVKPSFRIFKGGRDELEFMVRYIKLHSDEEIAILQVFNAGQSYESDVEKTIQRGVIPNIKEICYYLRNRGINAGYKYFREDNLEFGKSVNVNVMTFHSSKGLQFDTVFLPFSSDFGPHKNQNKSLYVAMSRASRKLFITYNEIPNHCFRDWNEYKQLYDGLIKEPEKPPPDLEDFVW